MHMAISWLPPVEAPRLSEDKCGNCQRGRDGHDSYGRCLPELASHRGKLKIFGRRSSR